MLHKNLNNLAPNHNANHHLVDSIENQSASSADQKQSSQSQTIKSKLQQLVNYIWPITRSEMPKFMSTTVVMFCILGIQNLIRATKDSIVNTMIGTETTSFLKFWGVLPAAAIITIIYVKLINTMKNEHIFYLIMSMFLVFFWFFAFHLFPNYQLYHLSPETAAKLVVDYPNFKWFVLLVSNWSFSLFYIIAELWPNAVFALLFWQFVNNITTITESKRFYFLFGLLGQTGLYLSGLLLMNLPAINVFFSKLLGIDEVNYNVLSIQIIMTIVLILGIIALAAFWILNHKILDTSTTDTLRFKVKQNQMSLVESFWLIMRSRYIRLIAVMLICYGLAINLVEGPWKSAASKIYKTPTEFAAFVGGYLSYTGILTICFVLLGSNIVRTLGWLSAAIITPLMMLVTGFTFFVVANVDPIAALMMASFSFTDPLILAVIIGAIQNVLSKSSKYTLFDSTKEMAYVPIVDEQLKIRGKAAVDMLSTKLGKSGSALLQSMIFVILPTATYTSISICLMVIFVMTCVVWIWAVLELNKEYLQECAKYHE